MAAKSQFDVTGWTKGKVSLFQALGLKGATYPEFSPELVGAATVNSPGPARVGQTQPAQPNSGQATGNLGGTSGVNGCTSKQTAANQQLGRKLAAGYGWGTGAQWDALNQIAMAESGWCQAATNPGSGAYGIPQALPGSKMATAGSDWRTNPSTQIKWMLQYIKQRYGNPVNAWNFHKANGFY